MASRRVYALNWCFIYFKRSVESEFLLLLIFLFKTLGLLVQFTLVIIDNLFFNEQKLLSIHNILE